VTGDGERDRLATLVHEVRSPVAALAAIAEAYREADSDVRRSLVSLAIAACSGIARIMSGAAVTSMELASVEPGKLVDDIVTTWRLSGAKVAARHRPDLPTVSADPIRIRQALDNLVANALAYSGSGDPVVISAVVVGDELRLSVEDTGIGIPVSEQERIFEPGARIDTGQPGSGLGLALARAIAEAHGGRLHLDSAPGRGATFMLALPVGRP
jgi:signal transduction histidine kinase